MAKAEENTQKQKRVIIQKSQICNYGRARYLFENAVAGVEGYKLSESFKSAIMNLPDNYDQQSYTQFIENWGTVSASIYILTHVPSATEYNDIQHVYS